MNDKVNESGQLNGSKSVSPGDEFAGYADTPRRLRVRQLLTDMGPSRALEEMADLCATHVKLVTLDKAKNHFADTAAHLYRAASLIDGYLIPPGPRDAMDMVIGEVRRCGVGKDLPDDHEVVQELFASYRETVRQLNEAKDTLGLRAVDKANIAALRKTLGHISEISAANLETLNANGLVAKVLAILNDPTDTCEVSASSVERLRAALIAHAKDTNPHDTATGFTNQAAEVIVNLAKQLSRITDLNKRLDAVEASVAQEAEAQAVATDKLTGHPIGCEAHFAGIRFHCHKTHKRYYEDRRQTFVTFEVYATTQLDREAINALRHHAEVATIAPLHTALLGKVKGYARLTSWPAYPATSEAEVTFQFELHATKEEAEEANRRLFGHQGHVDSKAIAEGNVEMLRGETVPRADGLYSALINMMALLWKARFHEEPATEDASPAAEFVNEHQATLEKLADAFADPLDDFLIVPLGAKDGAVAADTDESATSPHAQAYTKGFEPFVATPENDPTPGGAAVSLDGRKAEVLARLRVGPWTFQKHSPPDKLTLDALKSLLDDGLCFTYAGPKGWEFSTVWEASPTTDEAEVMAATLSLIDGGTLISTYKGGPPAGGPRTEAALKKLADFGTIERWEDGNHICYGSRATRAKFGPNAGAYTKPHASPFEGKPFDDTDPRNQVHALIEEHGSYGRPFGKSLSFNRDGLLVNDQPHAMNEPIKLVVALLELEQAAPTDLKGYGFTDAAMLVPAASNATREHAAICLAYAGLFHDLRQALQRSLSGLATSAKYNAEQSSDMLAYWTAELARMPVPTAPATKPTPAS